MILDQVKFHMKKIAFKESKVVIQNNVMLLIYEAD